MEEQSATTAAARRGFEGGHADAAVRTGSAHHNDCSPCQDYAAAASQPRSPGHRFPFAIVSDGCGSGDRTDLGARATVAATFEFLAEDAMTYDGAYHDMVPVGRLFPGGLPALLSRIEEWFERGQLGPRDALATLGVARSYPGGCSAHLLGDGAIVRYGARSITVSVATWAGNMPLYPAYLMTPEARADFFRESARLAAEAGTAGPLSIETRTCRAGQTWEDCEAATSYFGAEEAAYGLHYHFADDDDVEALAVMTDGVAQVGTVSPWPVCAALAAVGPAREGAFARRRMRGAMSTFLGGGLGGDDLAVGAIARRARDAG
jgi:hypothetical protein